jgi:hypothetical protein
MGFQIGSVVTMARVRYQGIILNASVFCPMDEYDRLSDLTHDYEYAIRSSTQLSISNISLEKRSFKNIRKVSGIMLFSESGRMLKSDSYTGPAKDAEISYTGSNEVFKRFSAYEDDRRITERKGLYPGTFGTTEEDAKCIKTGMDAIARYALENKMSANNVFTIKPPVKTKLQQGIVEPAYGEPGGGVEVIFVDGSPDNTVTGPIKILGK